METAATGKDGKTTITEYFVRRDGDSMAIANDITDPETELPSESNARLIAAAPELLEACKSLCSVFVCECENNEEITQAALIKARLAIKKATDDSLQNS